MPPLVEAGCGVEETLERDKGEKNRVEKTKERKHSFLAQHRQGRKINVESQREFGRPLVILNVSILIKKAKGLN